MLDVAIEAYEHERGRYGDDPTATWAAVSLQFSDLMGVGDDNPKAWLLVGVLVEAVTRVVDAEGTKPGL